MGADRTIILSREITPEEFEAFMRETDIHFYRKNEKWWKAGHSEWETSMDVNLDGNKLSLHYGYWGRAHVEKCDAETRHMVRALNEIGLIKDMGKWNY